MTGDNSGVKLNRLVQTIQKQYCFPQVPLGDMSRPRVVSKTSKSIHSAELLEVRGTSAKFVS